jgi:DeoR/GlpR family transcriptional regulator of sugar metabolism
MADNSNKVYLLVDSSKLFKRATFFTIPIDKINAIVTDDKGNELLRSLPSRIKIV